MIYGTRKNDLTILTHPFNPYAEVNGFKQNGSFVPVTAPRKRRGVSSYYGDGSRPQDILTTGGSNRPGSPNPQTDVAVVPSTPMFPDAEKGMVAMVVGSEPKAYPPSSSIPWFLNSATALQNPPVTAPVAQVVGIRNWPPDNAPSGWSDPTFTDWNRDGVILGTPSGSPSLGDITTEVVRGRRKRIADVQRKVRNTVFNFPVTNKFSLGDLIPDGQTIDINALKPSVVPLSLAGSYQEGRVQDTLDRLNILREALHKGLVSQSDFNAVERELVTNVIPIVEGLARSGSKPASVVNTLWGEIQNQGYVKPINGQWVVQTSPAWPPNPVRIVFPKPNHPGLFKQITSNPIKAAASGVAKFATGGVTLVTETGVLGKDAKEAGKKLETVAAGVSAGAATGAVASGFNPIGAVVGGVAGGAKGVVEATKSSDSGSAVKALEQGAVYGAVGGAVTGATAHVLAAQAEAAKAASAAAAEKAGFGAAASTAAGAGAPAAEAAGYGAAGTVAKAASGSLAKTIGYGAAASVAASLIAKKATGQKTTPADAIDAAVLSAQGIPTGSDVVDTIKGKVATTLQDQVAQAKSDPKGYIDKLKNLVSTGKQDVAAVTSLFGGGGSSTPSSAPSASVPTESPSFFEQNTIPLLAGIGIIAFMYIRKRR